MESGCIIKMEKKLKRQNKSYSIVDWYIIDCYGNKIFTIICNDNLSQRIIDKLNGDSIEKFDARKKMNSILIDDVIVLKIRNISEFINTYNLSMHGAINKQINLMNFVVEKLIS